MRDCIKHIYTSQSPPKESIHFFPAEYSKLGRARWKVEGAQHPPLSWYELGLIDSPRHIGEISHVNGGVCFDTSVYFLLVPTVLSCSTVFTYCLIRKSIEQEGILVSTFMARYLLVPQENFFLQNKAFTQSIIMLSLKPWQNSL